MASTTSTYIYIFFLYSLIPLIPSQHDPAPIKTLVLPISKHPSTLQYTTTLYQRTPLVPISLVINLGGPFLWVSCENSSYKSSSYRSAQCRSPLCSLARKSLNIQPQCSNNTCMIRAENVITSKISSGNLSIDVLSLRATDGLKPTRIATIPRFVFSCADEFLLQGLPSGATGIVGFGLSQISLPSQLADQYNFTRKFAICISSSMESNGVIFIGEEPYVLSPGIDVSKILIYTPLAITSKNVSDQLSDPHEYSIIIRYIRINGKHVPLNSSYTKIKTKISTINPYTFLETSIYNSVTNYFIQEAVAANATRVKEVAPFKACFDTKSKAESVTRPAIPFFDLMLQSEIVFWRVFETNLMVLVNNDTACLGFLDGGVNQKYGIIIGSYQLEDNFLQFDMVKSRLGFTSSLLLKETTCDSFNFTSTTSQYVK